MERAPRKYRAFISYSHRDKAWADWLHKGLERYKVPKSLVGRETSPGEAVPARIFPVFRDREELPTAVDLGEIINRALEQSHYLIVICSPASARSLWVNREIIQFKRLGNENRVLAIIVEGEPNASGNPGFTVEQECFPEALRYKLGGNGQLSSEPNEPIAADARVHADGKANAFLRLVAGLLGLHYDDLKRRDEAQQRKRRRVALATTGAISVTVTGLAITAWTQRIEAIGLQALADEKSIEVQQQSQEATAQRQKAEYSLAEAELGQARQALANGNAAPAIQNSLRAIERAEAINRELDAAWQVLRRAMDLQAFDAEWQAHRESISSIFFDAAGDRLLTSCKALDEVTVWSADDGRPLATMKFKAVELAAWAKGKDEVVMLRASASGSELGWWDVTKNIMLRKQVVPGTLFSSVNRYGTENPQWISLIEFVGRKVSNHLIRLADGFADYTISRDQGQSWTTEFVSPAGVALSATSAGGVHVFSLRTGLEESQLAGIGPTERIGLSSLIPSADGSMIAGVILSDERPVTAGVWRQKDGARLAELPPEELQKDGLWLLAASENRLIGPPLPGLEKIAVALGRTALTHVAYAPLARRLALVSTTGAIKILRLDRSPVHREAGLPAQVNLLATARGFNQVVLRTGEAEMVTWDLATRKVVAMMKGSATGKMWNAAYFPSTTTLWNAGEDWIAVIPPTPDGDSESAVTTFHDTRTGAMLGEYRLKVFDNRILLAPRGRRAIAPLPDRKWELLAVDHGKLNVIPVKAEPLDGKEWSINPAFSPDGEKVFISPGPGWLQEFATSTGLPQPSFKFAGDQEWSSDVSMITVHPSGAQAILGTIDSTWKVDLETKVALSTSPRSRAKFLGMGEIVVFEEGDRTHWERWSDLTRLGNIDGSFDLSSSGFLGDAGYLVLVKEDFSRSLIVASIDGGTALMTLDHVIGLDIGLGLAVADSGGNVRIVRLHDGEIVAEIPNLRASNACFSADGSRVGLVLLDSQRFVSLPLAVDREELRKRAMKLRVSLQNTERIMQ